MHTNQLRRKLHADAFGHRVRTLWYEGIEKDICATCGILDPGKYEGQRMHAIRDYDQHDEIHGDEYGGCAVWKTGHRYYVENSDGFVGEINRETYDQYVTSLSEREEEVAF